MASSLDNLRVLNSLTQTHVGDNLCHSGNLMDIRVLELLGQGIYDLLIVQTSLNEHSFEHFVFTQRRTFLTVFGVTEKLDSA